MKTIQSVGAPAAGPQDRKPGPVAESLLSGRLGTGVLVSSDGSAPATTEADGTGPFDPAAPVRDAGRHLAATPTAADESSSAVLPGGTAVSSVESAGRRMPFFRSAAQIGRQAAQGLAHAHARGVVHRDIKPSNLLLDTAGVVWITDFGLAKAEEDGLTATGDILGTLRYMAPERFRGEGDARADIYALGLTLYELLTLRPAFATSDRLRLIERIKTEEPARPRSLDARIPRDLETIVLKASEKDPALRYATAEAMAEDLRRFLADEPIQARRIGGSERAWRWCRRNPGLASAKRPVGPRPGRDGGDRPGLRRPSSPERAPADPGRRARAGPAEELRGLARAGRAQGGCEPVRAERGRAWPALAGPGPGIRPGGPAGPATGDPPEHRSLEPLGSAVARCAGILPERDRRGRQPRRDPCSRRQQGRHGAALGAGDRPPDRTGAAARRIGAGRRLQPRWDPGRHRRRRFPGAALEVGHRRGGEAALDHGGSIECVDFSPDGRFLATSGFNRCARLWDLSDGHSIALTRGPDAPEPPGEAIRWSVRFAPGGTRLITTRTDWSHGQQATSQLWAVPTGAPIGPEMKHDSVFIWAMDFDREGKRLLAAGNDGRAWLWDVATGTRKVGPFRHLDAVMTAAFSPDGRSFATGCGDGTICVWDPGDPG